MNVMESAQWNCRDGGILIHSNTLHLIFSSYTSNALIHAGTPHRIPMTFSSYSSNTLRHSDTL